MSVVYCEPAFSRPLTPHSWYKFKNNFNNSSGDTRSVGENFCVTSMDISDNYVNNCNVIQPPVPPDTVCDQYMHEGVWQNPYMKIDTYYNPQREVQPQNYPANMPILNNGNPYDTSGNPMSLCGAAMPQQEYNSQRVNIDMRSFVPNLPCNQNSNWNYNSMCFDVNGDGSGSACRFTKIVDLEDFMNNEKRKEKSRDAARCRRTRETQIFTELAETLPVRREDADQLDKASVMRLAISYLRARDVVHMLPEIKVEDQPEQESVDSTTMENPDVSYLEALDGFVFVISSQGDIVYLSENIADYLGVSQIEMVGQSVFEFSHPCDHDELRDVLRAKPKNRSESGPSSFFLRLKCTLTSKGRSVNLKSASYKVIHFTGHVLFTAEGQDTKPNNLDVNQNKSEVQMDETDKKLDENTNDEKCDDPPVKIVKSQGSLIAIGRPIPHPSNIEIPLSNTFLSKHNLDMKFTYADESMLSTLGYEPQDLTGKSLFEYHYTVDSRALAQNFKCLFSKGQCETGRYRFLAKRGGYAWVQTQATVIYDKQQRPVSVVCVNYVISGVESADEVLSGSQLRWRADVKPAAPGHAPTNGAPVAIVSERPRPATAQIFAPRTKDMNKGFLMFSEEDPGLTMLKEEPEDLTHLAPTAGDACIPLEDNPFDVFDAFILDDNYCDLLEHTASPDSLLLSEPDVQESNSSCSQTTPSLCSETSLEASAPYIPMVGGDELPLLAPAELVMWGALPDHVSLHRPAPALGLHPQDILDNIYPEQGELATWRPMTEEPLGARDAARDAMRDAARDVMRDAKRDAAREAARESGKRGAPPEGEQQAKRARAAPADSVLMNLLDGGPPKTTSDNIVNRTSAIIINKLPFRLDSAKAPLKCDTNESDINMQCPMSIPSNLLSPLSLNLSNPASPYYQPSLSSHSSPGYTDCSPRSFPSPLSIISPLATKVQGYAYDKGTALLSPGGVLRSDLDPLLTHTVPDDQIQNKCETLYKMDAVNNLSPGLGSDTKLFDEAVTPMMTDLNVWMETDQLLNDTGNILSGFDV